MASLTLLEWYLTKNTVRTRAVNIEVDRVFVQPSKPLVLDAANFILTDDDTRHVTNIDDILRRVRRDVDERTDGQINGLDDTRMGVVHSDKIPDAMKTESNSDDSGRVDDMDQRSVVAVA